jgi:ribosomal protein S18 acetylase RimI-like enzyme
MHALQLLAPCWARLERHQGLGQIVVAGTGEDRLQAGGALGMPAAGLMVEIARMGREQYGHQVGGYRRSTVTSVEPPRAGSLTGSRRRPHSGAATTVRIDGTTVRLAPWPADQRIAQLTVLPGQSAPTSAVVRGVLAAAAAGGFRAAVTGALGEVERPPFLDAGLTPRAWLHLLERPLVDVPAPEPGRTPLRRIRRSEWPALAALDASAFSPFWRLGIDGIVDARRATPSNRLRVAAGPRDGVVGYAVFGRSGTRGFVQRIAVHPSAQGHGTGATLLLDGLRWLADRGATSALVNTQVGNDRALQLYQRMGFRLLHERLAVLGRSLVDVA